MKVYNIHQIVALYLTLQPLPPALISERIHDAQSQQVLINQLITNRHVIACKCSTPCIVLTIRPIFFFRRSPSYGLPKEILEKYNYCLGKQWRAPYMPNLTHGCPNWSLPPMPRQGPPEASYLTYLIPRPQSWTTSAQAWHRSSGIDNFSQDHRPLTIQESRTTIERGTTGLRTCVRIQGGNAPHGSSPDPGVRPRVLELGSGVGLLGLLVATLQQLSRPTVVEQSSCIYMTDVDDDVLARCGLNVRDVNQSSKDMLADNPNVHVRALDWEDSVNPNREPFVLSLLEEIDADVVLAADVVYDPSIIAPLTRTLRLALERPFPAERDLHGGANSQQPFQLGSPRSAYIALTLRREQTFSEFLSSAGEEQEGLFVEFIDMDLPPDDARVFCTDNISGAATTRLMRLAVAG
ncbi:putative methyltransferase domain-containing protein [Rhizoctonia solani AG-1 IA]|nr:putative methyltransferase domain-containing protein [Rhizoctonia solani AG-1 IA]